MSELPFSLGYEQVHPTTWFYLSSLLMVGLYFKFSRAWSVRNLDLLLLILLGPGLLLQLHGSDLRRTGQRLAAAEAAVRAVSDKPPENLPGENDDAEPSDGVVGAQALNTSEEDTAAPTEEAAANAPESGVSARKIQRGRAIELLGFIWLFAVGALLLVRMLFDPMMVRRPLLEPNLSSGGLIFIGCALFMFLMANVVTGTPTADDLTGPQQAEALIKGEPAANNEDTLTKHGPGYPLMHMVPVLATGAFVEKNDGQTEPQRQQTINIITAKIMAVLAHFAIIAGIVLIGYRHFDNLKMGIGAATLYLMLPYTAEMTGRVPHAVPAALLVWAVLCYRRPLTAGVLLGLAMGVFYYPLFLLPLWLSFYWQRGLMRFMIGVLIMLGLTILSLVFTSADVGSFWEQFQQMFGLWFAKLEGLQGVWGLGWDPVFRLPVLATFFALAASFALWPAQKNLGTLMSCSAALMIATQFWHGFGGGLFIGWYLPLLLLTVFRPNLEDRIALTVLGEGWFPRRRRRTDARPLGAKDSRAAMVTNEHLLPYRT